MWPLSPVALDPGTLQVAVVGVSTPSTESTSAGLKGSNLTFLEPLAAMKSCIAALKLAEPHIDLVIALTHIGVVGDVCLGGEGRVGHMGT